MDNFLITRCIELMFGKKISFNNSELENFSCHAKMVTIAKIDLRVAGLFLEVSSVL